MTPRAWRGCALVACALLLTPWARHALESRMSLHMLVQVPLLLACGAILAAGLPARVLAGSGRWNAHGISGLLAFALGTALLMIPRVLDLAVADVRFDVVKALILLACGAALRLSWPRAGLLVQAFFLGNVLPMTAAVGQVYQDAPLRLCNAYLLDDQVFVGQALVALAAAVGVVWLARAGAIVVRREAAA